VCTCMWALLANTPAASISLLDNSCCRACASKAPVCVALPPLCWKATHINQLMQCCCCYPQLAQTLCCRPRW
jgi:hypothetical protein